ncbi:hypothetical protein GCM10027020_11870 [Nocardioides salsibiostraticola]
MTTGHNEFGQGEGTLTRAASMVTDAKADFMSISNQMTGKLQGMSGQFVGQGGTAFTRLHTAWAERQRTIVGALDDFAESLTLTEKDNLQTDEVQSASMTSLANRLG